MRTNWVERLWVDGPWRTPFQVHEIARFRRLHDLQRAPRVLEIGCGRGVGSLLILKHFDPGHIDAIDIDPAMIRRARRRLTRGNRERISFRVGDAQALDVPPRSMSAVFNFGILHHLEDWERGIREVARVLRPGGLFYFEEIYPDLYAGPILRHLVTHPRTNRFRGEDYRAALARAGLHLLDGYRETRYTIVGAAVREA